MGKGAVKKLTRCLSQIDGSQKIYVPFSEVSVSWVGVEPFSFVNHNRTPV